MTGSPGSRTPPAFLRVVHMKLTIYSSEAWGGTPPTYNLLACRSLTLVNDIGIDDIVKVLVVIPGAILWVILDDSEDVVGFYNYDIGVTRSNLDFLTLFSLYKYLVIIMLLTF